MRLPSRQIVMTPSQRPRKTRPRRPADRTREAGQKRLAVVCVLVAVVLILLLRGVTGIICAATILGGWEVLIKRGLLPDTKGPFRR